ncbi:MAG: hypothetical protein WDM79_17225 [Terricaulis sp.]
MTEKWVDNSSYLGPDRRHAIGNKMRWKERRRFNEASDLASLSSLLRRLRVQMSGLDRDDNRTHALQLARAALAKAESQQSHACADEIRETARLIAILNANDRNMAALAEQSVLRAIALAELH